VFEDNLKEVIAIIRPERWLETKLKVESLGIFAYTQHRVVGRGRQRGLHFLARRGASAGTGFRYLPKRMASWIVPETQVDKLVRVIIETNRTGQIGDGKIFLLPVSGMMQVASELPSSAGAARARQREASIEDGKADAVAAAGVVLVNHSLDQHHPVCAG